MATPTTGALVVVGSAGGMAPFPTSVYADIEGVGSTWATGSGNWPEGRWAFQLIDDSTKAIYDSGLMNLTCPNSSVTATAYNRYGSAPNAGCVIFGAGTYYWRVKYQNRDGDWSAWVNSATFTVAANTRTKLYVSSGGNDSNDGSSGSPKLTLAGAAAAVSTNDVEIIVSDDETVNLGSAVDISARNGIYVRRSGTGTNPPKVVLNQSSGTGYRLGDDHVIDGIEWEYDGVTLRSCITMKSAATNWAVMNQNTNEVTSLMEIPSGTDFVGGVIYGGNQIEQVSRYMLFADGFSVLNVLGVTWDAGSDTEHIIRLASTQTNVSKFASVDFSTLDYASDTTGKNALRVYVTSWFGAYRTRCKNGKVEFGNIDTTTYTNEVFTNYRIDCFGYDAQSASSRTHTVFMYQGLEDIVIASSVLYRDTAQDNPTVSLTTRAGSPKDAFEVKFLATSIYNGNSQNNGCVDGDAITGVTAPVIEIRGCLLQRDEASLAYGGVEMTEFTSAFTTSGSITDSIFYDSATYGNAATDIGGTDYTVAELNAESWGSGNVEANLTIDVATGAVSGGTSHQGALSDITGVFESINGVVLDRGLSSWDAGAFQRTALGTGEAAGYSSDVINSPAYIGGRDAASSIILLGA